MDSSLSVRDLPDAWAEKYKQYLGIEVTNPVEGVLQDIHWAHGAIGYFPTMILGRCYAAMIGKEMQREIGDLSQVVRSGNLARINQWNREKLWRKVGLYDTSEIIGQINSESVNAKIHIKYLTQKYTELYNL